MEGEWEWTGRAEAAPPTPSSLIAALGNGLCIQDTGAFAGTCFHGKDAVGTHGKQVLVASQTMFMMFCRSSWILFNFQKVYSSSVVH